MDYYYVHWMNYEEWINFYNNYQFNWENKSFWTENDTTFIRWIRGLNPYASEENREFFYQTYNINKTGRVEMGRRDQYVRCMETMNAIIESQKGKIFDTSLFRTESSVRVAYGGGWFILQIHNPFYFKGEEVVRFKNVESLVWVEVDRERYERKEQGFNLQLDLFVIKKIAKISAFMKRKNKMAFLYFQQAVEKDSVEEGIILPEVMLDQVAEFLSPRKRPREELCLRCGKHPS